MVNVISQVLMSIGVFIGNKGLCYFASVVFGAGGPVVIAQSWSLFMTHTSDIVYMIYRLYYTAWSMK